MQIVCPECFAPYASRKPVNANKLTCPKCKTVFLTPVELLLQHRALPPNWSKKQKALDSNYRRDLDRLSDKYATMREKMFAEAQQRAKEREAATDETIVKQPLANKLLRICLLIYFLVVCVVTAGLMTYQYNQNRNQIIQDLQSSARIFGKGLGGALWNVDPDALKDIIAGMLEHPAIVGVKVMDEDGQLVGAGGIIKDKKGQNISLGNVIATDSDEVAHNLKTHKKDSGRLLEQSFPIRFFAEDGSASAVGSAVVFSKAAYILDRVKGGYWLLGANALIVAIALLITLLWVSRVFLTRPLSDLTHAVSKLNLDSLDNLEVQTKVRDANELKVLETSFNAMVKNLVREKKTILNISKTFEKFVPKQFLSHIAEEGINSIKLGGMESENLTVLYGKIHAVDGIQPPIAADKMFRYLNAYLAQMEAPIEKHGGFIYQINKDAVMALFDLNDQAVEALCAVYAAIDIQKALVRFNQDQNIIADSSLAMQIGIHIGEAAFGTLGNDSRLDPTILGEATDTVVRLQSLAETYNSQILLSWETFNLIEARDTFSWRKIDSIEKTGQRALDITYEVFDAEPLKDLIRKICPDFNKGVKAFRQENWDRAITHFGRCLNAFPLDRATQKYLACCRSRLEDASGLIALFRDKTEIFKSLNDTAIARLAKSFAPMTFTTGEVIVAQGQVGSAFYIVLDGSVNVIVNSGSDAPKEVATLKKGDCFGEMSLMTGEAVMATIKGAVNGQLLALSADGFDKMLQDYPTLNPHFYKLFLERMQARKTE